jgi:hypothetical protein
MRLHRGKTAGGLHVIGERSFMAKPVDMEGRANWHRGERLNLSAKPNSLQTAGPILDRPRRPGALTAGNLLVESSRPLFLAGRYLVDGAPRFSQCAPGAGHPLAVSHASPHSQQPRPAGRLWFSGIFHRRWQPFKIDGSRSKTMAIEGCRIHRNILFCSMLHDIFSISPKKLTFSTIFSKGIIVTIPNGVLAG